MTSEARPRRIGILVGAVSFAELLNFLIGPFGMSRQKTFPDFLFLFLLLLHGLWALRLARGSAPASAVRNGPRSSRSRFLRAIYRTPEVLFLLTIVLFLLSFIFASNANMDYVQRFAAAKGNILLAPDSAIQRWNSASRFVPLLLLQLALASHFRLRHPRVARAVVGGVSSAGGRSVGGGSFAGLWGLPLTLLSTVLYTLAFPSFLSTDGYGALAFVALVPLLLVFYDAPYGWAVFYGITFGIVETMLTNYWLGTFSLVSLQFITVVMALEFAILMLLMLLLFKRLPRLGFLIAPVAWTAFDWLKALGFLGYPWGMIGTTQYRFTPFIQIAAVTGVWGVSFLVTLVNGAIAHAAAGAAGARRPAAGGSLAAAATSPSAASRSPAGRLVRLFAPAAAALLLVAADLAGGFIAVGRQELLPADRVARVALVQQNTDPRKNDYANTFEVLRRLTAAAMAEHPDLVAWSETAFVPNIRKWSALDPKEYPYAKLVDEFLAYQRSLHVWLLTGNDDYSEAAGPNGTTLRYDYNASVLFSPSGQRVDTYHKIHLVPFTEYFPYKRQLPFLYELLMNFDVYLWEPGTRHVVFRTPDLSFSTPICFEDAFPADVRQFVLAGAEVIMNISNDYWSLTPTEGQQHFMNSLFRAVENRRPLLRATASGVTGYVDPAGRLVERLPFYEAGWMMARVPIGSEGETFYTRYGDWFPALCLALFAVTLFVAGSPLLGGRSPHRPTRGRPQ